jgi:hypothetical protein
VCIPKVPEHATYVEFLPSSITLSHEHTELEIPLDLYEMLMRIKDGYVATAGEMKAFFLNLLMFKKKMLTKPTDRLLLTATGYRFYEVTRTHDNRISFVTT